MILDNMDMDDLMCMCYDLLLDNYEKFNEEEAGKILRNVKTSETSATVVSIWPDQATADKAMEAVSNVRSAATTSFDSTIVSAQSGPVVVKA